MLDASLVEELHKIVIEPHQLQGSDKNKLDSCLHRLVNKIHYEGIADIHEAAAVIVESVALSHSFSDGNKRTSLLSMMAFYLANNHKLPNIVGTDVAKRIEALAAHELSVAKLASWLRQLPALSKGKLQKMSDGASGPTKNIGPMFNTMKSRKSRW